MANSLENVSPLSSPPPSPPQVCDEEATPPTGTEVPSVGALPRKSGLMVIGGEGTSEDRAKRANVEPPVPAPAPAPEPPVLERTCFACDMVFDTMILFLRHMQTHQVLETSYVPDLNQDQVPNWTRPYEPIASPDDDNSSDISVDDGTADADAGADADVPAAPREPVYLLPDLNLPAPEEDEDEDDDEDDDGDE